LVITVQCEGRCLWVGNAKRAPKRWLLWSGGRLHTIGFDCSTLVLIIFFIKETVNPTLNDHISIAPSVLKHCTILDWRHSQ
jgi:hypothetical protein